MSRAPITVIKNDHEGREVWRYTGETLSRTATQIVLEAFFIHPSKEDVVTDYVTFRRGDRMIETFYADRWYNVFEIHDVDDDGLKGWYCNFTRPAQFDEERTTSRLQIAADDLALDVFVFPSGEVRVLDQDEFDALPLADDERASVLAALSDLEALVREGQAPFVR